MTLLNACDNLSQSTMFQKAFLVKFLQLTLSRENLALIIALCEAIFDKAAGVYFKILQPCQK